MKVLIVDNVKLMQVIISNLFEDSNLEPVMEENGANAMCVLQQQDIDVICISMYLSDTDGVSLCKEIRQLEKYRYIPIILFTSEESPEILKKAMSSGVTEIFNKQDVHELVSYIKRFTCQHQKIDAHILYVEDMLSQRAVTTAMFEEYGITVDDCASGEEAWVKIQSHDYDLIVTDIVLEGAMSGIGLVNLIRRLEGNKGDVPILAITGFDDISRRIELFYLGVNDYVIKPVIQQEIIARVKNLINGYRATQEKVNLIFSIFEKSQEGVFIAEFDKTVCSVNKTFKEITGYSETEILEKSPFQFSQGSEDYFKEIWNKVDLGGSWEGKITRKHKSGRLFSEWLNLICIKNAQNIITHYIGRSHLYKER